MCFSENYDRFKPAIFPHVTLTQVIYSTVATVRKDMYYTRTDVLTDWTEVCNIYLNEVCTR
jgi:hypothetical protein